MAAVQLPPLVQRIILDPTGVKGGVGQFSKSLAPAQKNLNQFGQSAHMAGNNLSSMGYKAQTVGNVMMKKLGLPIVAIGSLAAMSFAKFEASLTKIEALVGVSAGGVALFADSVRRVSRETGRGPQELADAMFFVASAGLRGATAMEVMEASAKGAAVGLGETKVVADAATSAVNAYGAENLSGGAAVDVLTAAVREGKVEADRLAPAIGKAIPVASAMGIEFHEVAAAIASMTRTGTDARTSAIQLRQIMQSILDPSRQTEQALREMGIAQGELAKQARQEGLLSVLVRLRDLANENEEAFADVFPNIRALAGAMDITGANLEENIGIFERLSRSAGDTDEAFQKVSKTSKFKFDQSMARLKETMIGLGESTKPLIDIFTIFLGVVEKLLSAFSNNKGLTVFITALGVTFIAVGALSKTIGFLTASLMGPGGLYFAFLNVATSSGAAATGIAGVGLAMKAIPILLFASAVVALTMAFVKFGRDSKSARQEIENLKSSMRDVSVVAGRALEPIQDWNDALRAMGEVGASQGIVNAFLSEFGKTIDDLAELADSDALVSAEEALLMMFSGAGTEDPAVTQAFETLIKKYEVQFRGQLEQGEGFLTRLFEGMSVDEAIVAVLTGGETVADAQIQAWVLGMVDTVDAVAQDGRDKMEQAHSGSQHTSKDLSFWLLGGRVDRKDIEAALVDPVEMVVKKMREGALSEAVNIYSEIMEGMRNASGMTGEDLVHTMAMVERAFMDQVHKQDLFVGDMGEGIDTMFGMMEKLASLDPDSEFLGGEWAGQENWIDFAKMLQTTFDTAKELARRGIISDDMIETVALQQAAKNMEHFLDTTSQITDKTPNQLRNVEDAFLDIEVAIESAGAEADKFSKRFDMLTGAARGLDEVQREVNQGLQTMVKSFIENGTAMDNMTQAGMENRENFSDLADLARDAAVAVLEAGGTQEQAVKEFEKIQNLIRLNATNQGALMSDVDAALDLNFGGDTFWQDLLKMGDKDLVTGEIETRLKALAGETMTIFGATQGQTQGAEFAKGLAIGVEQEYGTVIGKLSETLGENGLLGWAKWFLGISSPSVVFMDQVGRPITRGIAEGISGEKKTLINHTKDAVDAALAAARQKISSVTRAIRAQLSFEDAEQKVRKAMRDFGATGEITKREKLTERQLKRRKEDALRALRLGQGHQEDLEMALLDANEALSDFEQGVESGSPLAKAQLGLMEAGLEIAEAQAKMKMEGEKAKEMFIDLGNAIGLTGDKLGNNLIPNVEGLVDVTDENDDLFEAIIGEEVRQAIQDVADGLGWVKEVTEDVGAAAEAATFVYGGWAADTEEVKTNLEEITDMASLIAGTGGIMSWLPGHSNALAGVGQPTMAGLESMSSSFFPGPAMAEAGTITGSYNNTYTIDTVNITGDGTLASATGGAVPSGGPFENQYAGIVDGAGSEVNRRISAASDFGAFFGPGSRGG